MNGSGKEKAVFIFAGFLDSGKTTALQGTLLKTRERDAGKAVILCTEEGEEEYNIPELEKIGIKVIFEEDEENFDAGFLLGIDEEYEPEDIYIEFNGMWDLKTFLSLPLPEGWFIANVFGLVNAETFDLYLKNMRQKIMEPLKETDVILFNRCGENFKKGEAGRSLKILNPRAEVFFAGPDGKVDSGMDELLLEDENGVINVGDDLFCSWFVDCLENADKYYDRRVCFRGMVLYGNELKEKQFYIGRYAAVCCKADARYLGFVAQCEGEVPRSREWAEIEAVVRQGMIDGNHRILLLEVKRMEILAPPENIFLYF